MELNTLVKISPVEMEIWHLFKDKIEKLTYNSVIVIFEYQNVSEKKLPSNNVLGRQSFLISFH